jgi:sulfonate dioxygenase
MWDNRCSVHRVIPGTYEGNRKGIRTTVFGEKRELIHVPGSI